MKVIADLHIHSKYARACSQSMDIKHIAKYSLIKGLNLVGTGDFTHPLWIKELKENLIDLGNGIFQDKFYHQNFVLQTEISLIYTQGGKERRIHLLVLAPSFEVVDKITKYLLRFGRVDFDGRPIFKISGHDFVKSLHQISPDIEIIPAHIWTPWFGLLGSESGFDSVEECFGDCAKYIHALETGLSADPEMFWRVKDLDKYTIVSNSDSHSFWPWRIGREATIFELKELTYKNLINAIRTKTGVVGTIEFNPKEGKYHYDGHRNCGVSLHPQDSIKYKNICPVCGKPLTLGVLHRVEQLADREPGKKPADARPFYTLVPLIEIMAFAQGKKATTKKIQEQYFKAVEILGNEIKILLDLSEEKLRSVFDEKTTKLILKNRKGKIEFIPGYDGVYGTIKNNEEGAASKENKTKDLTKIQKQKRLI